MEKTDTVRRSVRIRRAVPQEFPLAAWGRRAREQPRGTRGASMSEGRALLRARQFFEPRQRSEEGWSERSTYARDWEQAYRQPLAARPRRPLHPRRQLHRLLLVEDPRQGRARHLGDAADRLPLQRPRHARLRAPRLPPRRLLLLVPVLAAAAQVPVRPRRPARAVPRGEGAARRPGRGLGRDRLRPREGARLQVPARQGRLRARELGGGLGADRRRPRPHDRASTAPTGSPASRRSRRCRWSPTRPAPASSR